MELVTTLHRLATRVEKVSMLAVESPTGFAAETEHELTHYLRHSIPWMERSVELVRTNFRILLPNYPKIYN